MIRTVLTVVIILIIVTVKAQEGCPPPFGRQNDVKRYHVAAGVGLTNLYGDIDKAGTFGKSLFVKGDYQIKRGLYAGIEGQFGSLEAVSNLVDLREVENNYLAGGIMVTFHPFEFFSKRAASRQSVGYLLMDGFYLGVGVLGIVNNYVSIYRDENYGNEGYLGPVPPGNYGAIEEYDENDVPIFKKKVNSITMPTATVGFAIPINRRYSRSGNYWSALINGQLNFANNDLLDGYMPYDAQFNRIGTRKDMYTMYSLGARYSF